MNLYEKAKHRLLNVNHWHEIAGALTASFLLADEGGRPVYRNGQLDDYFRIDIPGPGKAASKGYDWVQVEAFEDIFKEGLQIIGFRVRPAPHPAGDDNTTAHFYSAESISSFMVTCVATTVTVSVLDRNISPNNDTDCLIDQLRNSPGGNRCD